MLGEERALFRGEQRDAAAELSMRLVAVVGAPIVLPRAVAILVGPLKRHGVERSRLALDRDITGPDARRAVLDAERPVRTSLRFLRSGCRRCSGRRLPGGFLG